MPINKSMGRIATSINRSNIKPAALWTDGYYRYGGYDRKVLSYDPIACWALWDAGGSTAKCLVTSSQNGSYGASVTLGESGLDGRACIYTTGTGGNNEYVDIYSAAIDSAWDGAEFSISAWCRVANVDVWSDEQYRRVVELYVDDNNYIQVMRAGGDTGAMQVDRKGGGTLSQSIFAAGSTLGWMHVGVTVSETADQMIAFLNGSPQTPLDTLGTYTGSLDSTRCAIAASGNGGWSVWFGWVEYVALFGSALPASVMADLAIA